MLPFPNLDKTASQNWSSAMCKETLQVGKRHRTNPAATLIVLGQSDSGCISSWILGIPKITIALGTGSLGSREGVDSAGDKDCGGCAQGSWRARGDTHGNAKDRPLHEIVTWPSISVMALGCRSILCCD